MESSPLEIADTSENAPSGIRTRELSPPESAPVQGELIYEHSSAWQKRFEVPIRRTSFPKPSSSWQEREYEALMGELPEPPPEEFAWQWDYEPRRKASQKAFAEFTS